MVWWTIPGSFVSWTWDPGGGTLSEGRADAAALTFTPRDRERARWGPGATADGLPFADLTAMFALEANIVPTAMSVTWLHAGQAIRWHRSAGDWTRHGFTDRGGAIDLSPGQPLPGDHPRRPLPAAALAVRLLTSPPTPD